MPSETHYRRERQPLLEFDEMAKAINRSERERETSPPHQLELIEGPQQELFPILEMPESKQI